MNRRSAAKIIVTKSDDNTVGVDIGLDEASLAGLTASLNNLADAIRELARSKPEAAPATPQQIRAVLDPEEMDRLAQLRQHQANFPTPPQPQAAPEEKLGIDLKSGSIDPVDLIGSTGSITFGEKL